MRNTRLFGNVLFGTLAVALFANFATAAESEKLPPEAKVKSLKVSPQSLDFHGPYDYVQLVVEATLTNGDKVDVTRMASFQVPEPIKVSATGFATPAVNGQGELVVIMAEQAVKVPVNVKNFDTTPKVSFLKDVQPALSKLGCNQGTCHGAAEGRAGFKLSLRGYDPLFDHRSLTDDLEGRRFNRAAPEKSLMLMKPAGAVPHVGGVLCNPGDRYYELIRNWIANGVQLDLDAPKVQSIQVVPDSIIVPTPGMKQQFSVIATYTDGSQRDVSAESFIESSNTEVAKVNSQGLAETIRRGEATMLARYEGAYAAAAVIVMGDRSGFQWEQRPVLNWVDELVDAKLQRMKILPSELCTDEEFIRRVTLDLTGLPPSSNDVRSFLQDQRPSKEKRDELVDKLVGSEAFVEHWTNKWADLLQVNRKFLGDPGAKALRDWIRNAIATNMPYDQFAYQILTGTGSNVENPPAAYYKVLRNPEDLMENTTQLFLAIRFNCNKCHDHPFERWTQDQYYELAAYFAQVNRKEDPKYKGQKVGGTAVEGAKPLVEIIEDVKNGEVKHERTGEVTPPSFPFEHAMMPPADMSRRDQLAKWTTAKENPYFAKSYVNRLWSYLLGVGIIEPVDDIRAGNPPSNPELLDRLTTEFIQSGFNTQEIFKTICKSRTYQLSVAMNDFNQDDELNYSRALPRRLPAEVLFDSIHKATGAQSRLPGMPPGARAAQLLDSNVNLPGSFLELFGKPVRESACECERSNTMMLGPVLAMVNGPIVADAIKDINNHINQFTAANKDDKKVVEEIYLSVLNRKPTEAELADSISALGAAEADFKRLVADYEARKKAYDDYSKTLDDRQTAWEKSKLSMRPTKWQSLQASSLESARGAELKQQADGSIVVTGELAKEERYTVKAPSDLQKVTAIRLEALADDSLPNKGPGRADNGNFVLSQLKLSARANGNDDAEPKEIKLTNPQATFQQGNFQVQKAIDNNLSTGWAISPQTGKNQTAIFRLQKPQGEEGGTEFTITMDHHHPDGKHTLGKFRLSVTTDPNPRLTSPVPMNVVKLLDVPVEKRSEEQKKQIRQMYLAEDQEYQRLRAGANDLPPSDPRVVGAQDIVWALINSPAFLFNH